MTTVSDADTTFRIRSDSRPLYVQAEAALNDLIQGLGLQDGDRLPSEVELAERLGVSRSTIREALRNLELHRRVRRIHGRGTLVTTPSGSFVAGLETLESMESLASRQGWACGTEDVQLRAWSLGERDAGPLQRSLGTTAVRLTRAKTKDGVRVAFMDSVVPGDVIAPEVAEREFSSSIIDMFRARRRPVLDYALADIRVEPADPETAMELHVSVGSAMLLLEETFLDPDGHPFCLNRNWFVPGSVRLEFVRRTS